MPTSSAASAGNAQLMQTLQQTQADTAATTGALAEHSAAMTDIQGMGQSKLSAENSLRQLIGSL